MDLKNDVSGPEQLKEALQDQPFEGAAADCRGIVSIENIRTRRVLRVI
jgi:hypothetical protein